MTKIDSVMSILSQTNAAKERVVLSPEDVCKQKHGQQIKLKNIVNDLEPNGVIYES